MRIVLTVDQQGLSGGVQVSINQLDDNDAGHGYRILGPKYIGDSKRLGQRTLTKRDADVIRRYLDKVVDE